MVKIELPKREYEYKVGVAAIGYKSEKEIPRMFDPFLGHVDVMIYGGGKFDFYPGESYSKDVDFAIDRYTREVEFYGYHYEGRQVDKRQRYLDIAGKAKCDFLICIDTDDYIMPEYSDWDKFYKNLFFISNALPDRVFFKWVLIPSEKLWNRQGNEFKAGWRKSARIHKDPGTMRYCMDNHYMWCDKSVSDEKLLEWQLRNRDEPNPYQFEPHIVIDGVRDTMDRQLRTPEQVKAGEKWARLNKHAEESRKYYKIAKVLKRPPPKGFSSWDEFEKAPHTFDEETGVRIELKEK